ncbi:hypothetical protein QYF36_005484 [Acer negundo]|nr:hypothetical protein QYF36_005484 [Acer negundo]
MASEIIGGPTQQPTLPTYIRCTCIRHAYGDVDVALALLPLLLHHLSLSILSLYLQKTKLRSFSFVVESAKLDTENADAYILSIEVSGFWRIRYTRESKLREFLHHL